MSIDPAQIELTERQRARLAQLAAERGCDYRDLVDELLFGPSRAEANQTSAGPVEDDFTEQPSLYNELAKRGILGCFDGPTDLATNPKHMEGFGRDCGKRFSLTLGPWSHCLTGASNTTRRAEQKRGGSSLERCLLACRW
jgi:hypothetical protein